MADERSVAPWRRRRLVRQRADTTEPFEDHVDGVLGHLPVRSELAARDLHHPVGGHRHHVPAGEIGGAGVDTRRLHQRPQAGPRRRDVIDGDRLVPLRVEGGVERAEDVRNVLGGAHRLVEGSVVVGVRGADVAVGEGAVGSLTPGHDEQAALVARHRDHNSDVVAGVMPRDRDVHALGRPYRARPTRVVEGANRVRPHPGGVHHHPGTNVERGAAEPIEHGTAPGRRATTSHLLATTAPCCAAVWPTASVSRASSAVAS